MVTTRRSSGVSPGSASYRAWLALGPNVISSVAIVFCNKALMGSFGFRFATTLTALHFCMCAVVMRAMQGGDRPVGTMTTRLPFWDLAVFTLVADASIVALNLSLLYNSVSLYQVAKLLIIPCTCVIEYFRIAATQSLAAMAAIALVLTGVAIVTVEDLAFDPSILGVSLAAVSVIASSSQQVLVRMLQKRHALLPHELLAATAPAQAITLLAMGPFVDHLFSGSWAYDFPWHGAPITALAVSCLLAVAVNLSQFMCLGRLSAVSFQVLGHTKTVLVLLGSWVLLGERVSGRKLVGLTVAVTGMVVYSAVQGQRCVPASNPNKPSVQVIYSSAVNSPPTRRMTAGYAT